MSTVFSKYSLEARVFPTVLGLVPLFLLQYLYITDLLPIELLALLIVGNITLSLVLLYALSEFVVRLIGKVLEEKIFDSRKNMPTTRMLLFGDGEYSADFKERIRAKVNSDFGLLLPDAQEESRDEKEARVRIKEVVGLVIKHVGSGSLVLQHNIAYGFARNFWGTSVLGIIFGIPLLVVAYINSDLAVVVLSCILLGIYCIYILFGKKTIVFFGNLYARKLLEEYMSTQYEK